MPTDTSSFPPTQTIDPPTSARARLLAGTQTVTPGSRAPTRPPAPANRAGAATGPRAQGAATANDALPRWAKGVVIGGVLLAVAMPASVLLSRSMLVQNALLEESNSKAAMVCTAGEGRALDDSGVMGWLFGGSYFQCGDWETREARKERDRAQSEANFLARERAKQGLSN